MRPSLAFVAVLAPPLITALAAIVAAAPATALDRRVQIHNETSRAIVAFYGSHSGLAPSTENLLGEAVIPAGASVILDFDDGSGYCRFGFRAVFDDGVELERPSVNVCEVATFRYTD